jgi:hypothetical protein
VHHSTQQCSQPQSVYGLFIDVFRISENTTVNGRIMNKGKVKFALEEATNAQMGLDV